ncbi:S53 family peptidase [Streptomyces sp. NPDC093509]|uniref:S53 family peptidase n=1 Tax=Streptomyces sp. NPDC093509 TaxID=3154982 RepID=UPI00344D9C3E
MAADFPKAYGRTIPWEPCGYTPAQIRSAYGIGKTALTGKGVKIAIVSLLASSTLRADVNTYATNHGEKPFASGQLTLRLPADASIYLGDDEGTMDLEAVHAIAPDAAVVFDVGTGSVTGDGVLDALTDIVDHRLADVVTSSYYQGTLPGGEEPEEQVSPAVIQATEQSLQQAAVEGISVNFTSGDSGGLPDGTRQLNYPGSSPWVTSVGGTSLAIGVKGEYAWETGWETDASPLSADGTSWTKPLPGEFSGGAGGGASTVFPQPFFQRHVVPTALSTLAGGKPMRTIPDIAALADFHTGFLIGVSYPAADGEAAEYRESSSGGTSLACPLIAGMEALANQAAGGEPLGFANPALYALQGTKAYHDVTDHPRGAHSMEAVAAKVAIPRSQQVITKLFTLGQAADAGLVSGAGYDTVTGVGSPTGNFFDALGDTADRE